MMKVKVFIKNTVTLVMTSLLLRSIGIIFRIYLSNKIGSEGIGLYQLIFSVYMLVATFASTGVSTAVTRLVAENAERGRSAVSRIMKKAIILSVVVGGVTAVVTHTCAPLIAKYWIKDMAAVEALQILSFSLVFMGISSCIRGYFIARRKATQPSAAQLFEQLVRMVVIVLALKKSVGLGVAAAASAVLFGDTVAETASCALSGLLYFVDSKKIKKGGEVKGSYKDILHISLPLAGAGYVSTALHTAENLLVPTRLSLFYGMRERGLELYGAIRGMAMPVLFFPASFLTSLSTMLIPEVSESVASGDSSTVKRTVCTSLKTTMILSIFVGTVFLVWGEDLAFFIYKDRDVGYIIRVLSVIVPFMYMESVAAGILKGLDQQMSMFGYNLFDSTIRIIAVFLLLPRFGINGYLGVMIVSNCFTSSLCCNKLLQTADVKIDVKNWVLTPIFIAMSGGILSQFLFGTVSNLLLRLVLGVSVQTAIFAVYFIKKERKGVRLIRKCRGC